jgi:hypothetical protein
MPNELFGDEFQIEAPALDAAKHPALRGVTVDGGSGVVGVNHSRKSLGLLGGSDRIFRQSAGVYGESSQQGVFGHSTEPTGTGVYGNSEGSGFGVRGDSTDGIVVQGQSFGSGLAGRFIRNVEITDNLIVQGRNINDLLLQMQSLGNLVERVKTLEQKNQQLQQQVSSLTDRVTSLEKNNSGGSTGTPNISVTRGGSGGQNLSKFTLSGSGFSLNESITIDITSIPKFGQQSSSSTSTTSDSTGKFSKEISLFCDNGMTYEITVKSASGKSSNTIKTSC